MFDYDFDCFTCIPFNQFSASGNLFRSVVRLVDADLVGVVVVPLHYLKEDSISIIAIMARLLSVNL